MKWHTTSVPDESVPSWLAEESGVASAPKRQSGWPHLVRVRVRVRVRARARVRDRARARVTVRVRVRVRVRVSALGGACGG